MLGASSPKDLPPSGTNDGGIRGVEGALADQGILRIRHLEGWARTQGTDARGLRSTQGEPSSVCPKVWPSILHLSTYFYVNKCKILYLWKTNAAPHESYLSGFVLKSSFKQLYAAVFSKHPKDPRSLLPYSIAILLLHVLRVDWYPCCRKALFPEQKITTKCHYIFKVPSLLSKRTESKCNDCQVVTMLFFTERLFTLFVGKRLSLKNCLNRCLFSNNDAFIIASHLGKEMLHWQITSLNLSRCTKPWFIVLNKSQ